jgi:6-pyruvoyltetrahydropterin/6-carboxytetrahydropterin synthase
MSWEISRSFRLEAAHLLPYAPAGHKCRRLHGHSFEVTVGVKGSSLSQPEGWVCDFGDLARAWNPIHEQLDHRYLNDVPGLENPTSELLAAWLWERLVQALPGLVAIEVAETCTSRCIYRPE